MIEQIRTDRLAQVMLVGVVLAAIFACCVLGYFGYTLLVPTTEAMPLQASPKVSIFLLTNEGQSVSLWYRVVTGTTENSNQMDVQLNKDNDSFRWEQDLKAEEGDLVQMSASNLGGKGIACQFLIDGLTWLTDLATGTDECVLSGTVR